MVYAWTLILKYGFKVGVRWWCTRSAVLGDSPRTTTTKTTLHTQLRRRTATVRTRCSIHTHTHTHVREERTSAPLGRILCGPRRHRRQRQSPRDLWLEKLEEPRKAIERTRRWIDSNGGGDDRNVIIDAVRLNYTRNPRPACAFVWRCDTTVDWSEILIVAGTGTIRRAVTTITIHRQAESSCPPPTPWQQLYYYYYYYCCGTTRSLVVLSRCRRSSDRAALVFVSMCVCVCEREDRVFVCGVWFCIILLCLAAYV